MTTRQRPIISRHLGSHGHSIVPTSSPPPLITPTAASSARWTFKALLLMSAAGVLLLPHSAGAQVTPNTLPTGGQVTAGQAAINQSGARMDVNQGSQQAIINWQTFNIGSQAQVNFQQPNASAIALNRVLSAAPSQIFGKLTANGQVFLINGAGITFAPGAQVDVGGLVASTLNIKDADFLAGKNIFQREGSTGAIVNQGKLIAGPGGYIGLLAPEVRNQGVITAQLGTVILAAGEKVTMDFAGNGNVSVQVEPATVRTLIENNNLVAAPDGRVIMSAKAATVLLGGVINNTGVIEADSLTSDGGVVRLEASNAINDTGFISANAGGRGNGGDVMLVSAGTTAVAGEIQARGGVEGGNGGTVETSGGVLKIDGARVDTTAPKGKTGNWLLDPYDLTVVSGSGTVAPSGGSYTSGAGGSTVSNTDINNALATTNVTLQTGGTAGDGQGNGDINVNAPIAWSSGNGLTLNAFRDINVNANVAHSGSGGFLSLNPNTGGAGGNFNVTSGYRVTLSSGTSLSIGGTSYTLITTPIQLQAMNLDLAGHYALANDLDMTGIGGWTPIGSESTRFTGVFDGLGHPIANLTINQPANQYVGLFGSSQGLLNNVHLDNLSVTGLGYVGGLTGMNWGTVANSEVQGAITGGSGANAVAIGGLIGASGTVRTSGGIAGLIRDSYTIVTVVGGDGAGGLGGLVGSNYSDISNSFTVGSVTGGNGSSGIGGLVGSSSGATMNFPTISHSYAAVTVKAGDNSSYVGGLAGDSLSRIVDGSSARGSVTAGNNSSNVGGLVGRNVGLVDASFAIGPVTVGNGALWVGGLAGYNMGGIRNSYSVATVTAGTGATWIGGLVGANEAGGPSFSTSISNSFSQSTVNVGSDSEGIGGVAGRNADGAIIDHTPWFADVSAGTGTIYVGGLVGLNAGVIRNASYANGRVDAATSSEIGGLVGQNNPTGTIDGVWAAGPVSGDGFVGGLVGYNYGAITNSYASVQVQGNNGVGGLVGNNFGGTIGSSYALGTVTGGSDVGGLVGVNNVFGSATGSVADSFTQTFVTGMLNVGGLIGRNFGTISGSHTTGGSVTAGNGGEAVGGVVGFNSGSITNSYNTATVQSGTSSLNVGGLSGTNEAGIGVIDGSYNLASVSAGANSMNIGGLVGISAGSVTNSYASGASVTSGDGSFGVGGLAGCNCAGFHTLNGSIDNSYSIVSVSAGAGSTAVGGLVGIVQTGATVSRSWASSPVTAGDNSASLGGLAGQNSGAITTSAAFGSVAGGNGAHYIGGFVGYNLNGAISDSIAQGNVSGGSNSYDLGSLVGFNENSTITNSTGTGTVTAGPGSFNVGGQVGASAP